MIVELPYTTRKQLRAGSARLMDYQSGDFKDTSIDIFVNNPAGDGIIINDNIPIPGEIFTNSGPYVQNLVSHRNEVVLEDVMDPVVRPVGIRKDGNVRTITDRPLYQAECRVRIPASVVGSKYSFLQSSGNSSQRIFINDMTRKVISEVHVDFEGSDIYIYSSLVAWEAWNPEYFQYAYTFQHLKIGSPVESSETPKTSLYASSSRSGYPHEYFLTLDIEGHLSKQFDLYLDVARSGAYSSWVSDDPILIDTYFETKMPSESEVHEIVALAKSQGSRILDQQRALIRKPKYLTNNLAFEAMGDIGTWSNNGLAYMKDYAETRKLVNGFANSLKKTAKGKVKALASTFLAYHYGIRLTISDTLTLLEFLSKDSKRYRRVGCSKSYNANGHRITSRYHIYYDLFSDQVDEVYRTLTELDSRLTLDNAWDLIPYSFVIDWFVEVGDLLNKISNYRDLICTYKILSTLRTDKVEINTKISVGGQDIPLYAKTYCRKVLPYMPTPIPAEVTTNPAPFKHTLEGAALTIQQC